jgi:hypothetical protein
MTNTLRSFLVAGAVSLGLGAFGTPAGATTPLETFYFTGTCADCTGDGPGGEVTATLVLTGYMPTPDNPDFLPANFVSFSYGGSNLVPGFTVDDSTPGFVLGQLIGNFSTLPGASTMIIAWAISPGPTDEFSTGTDGTWTLSLPRPADQGANGS